MCVILCLFSTSLVVVAFFFALFVDDDDDDDENELEFVTAFKGGRLFSIRCR